MPITVRCPNPECGQTFHVPDAYAGKPGRCHKCKTNFTITASAGPSEQVTARPPQGVGVPQAIGRFQLRGKLGAGAFGAVYRAHDPQLDREVALKVPQAAVLDSPKRVERFLREAKAAAALRHPNIVPVYEAGLADGQHYIASAFIEGQPLARAVGDKGIGHARAARVVRDLAEALAYAHAAGVVHRDVKPANVMLDAEDQPHLMDFGLAARLESTEKLTHEGAVLGTPSYMSPEQAKGQEGDAKPESDQYSLGVVLYELLTGRTPFEGPPQVVLFNVLNTQPASPRSLRKDIPKDLETICLKAMAKDPGKRYSDCQALADDLRRWLEGEPIKARRPSLRENLARWFKQDPRLAGAIVTTVAALAVAAGALLWRTGTLAAALLSEKDDRAAERARAEEELDKKRKAAEDAAADGDQQRLRVAERMADGNDFGGIPAVLDGIDPARRGWEWRHLRLRGEGAAVKLLPGNRGLAAMTFDPASQVLLCATSQGMVRQWDVRSGKESRKLQMNGFGGGNHLALSADGSRLVGVRLPPRPWYPVNPLLALGAIGLTALPGAGPLQAAVTVAGGWRMPFPQFKEGKPNDVVVWDARTGAEIAKWQTSPGYQIHLAVDAAGKRVAIAVGEWNEASRLAVYDGDSGKVITAFEAPFLAFGGVVLSPNGEQVVTLSGPEGKLRKAVVWETKTAKESHTLETGNDSPSLVIFSPDGKKAATFCGGGMTVQKAVEKTVTVQVPVTKEIVLSDGSRQLVTVYETVQKIVTETFSENVGGGTPTVRVHDAAAGKELLAFSDGANVAAMAFSPDGSRLATAAGFGGCVAGNEVKLWDARTGAKLMLLKSPAQGQLTLVVFSPDGQHVAAGAAWQDVVTLWSATEGRLLHTIDRRSGGVCAVGFSPDGLRLTTFSLCDRTARVYDLEDRLGREVLSVAGATIPLAFGPSGAMLTGGRGGMGHYGYAAAFGYGMAPRPVGGCPGGCVTPVRFGGGTAGDGCLAKVRSPGLLAWRSEGMQRVEFPNDAGQVLAISPDGKRFVASAADAPLRVWDTEAKMALFALPGVTGFSTEVMFSPDGGLIAAFWSEMETVTTTMKRTVPRAKGDKTENFTIDVPVKTQLARNRLRVWEAASGKERFTQDDATTGFAFSHDGGLLACATGPSSRWPASVVLWDTRSGKVAHRLADKGQQYCAVRFAPDGKSAVAFAAGRPPMTQAQTRTGMKTETRTRMVKKVVEKDGKKVEENVPEPYTVCVPYTYTVNVLVKSPSVLTAWSTVTGKELLSKSGVAELFTISPDGSRLVTLTNPPADQPAPPVGMPMPAPAAVPMPPSAARLGDDEDRHFVAAQVTEAVPAPVPARMPTPPQPAKPRPRPVVQVWSLANGEELLTLTGHATEVTALAYSPDGTRLVTADLGSDLAEISAAPGAPAATTLVVWDAAAGVELARFAGHAARVNCVAWRPDGAAFASGSDDGTAKVWKAPVVKAPLPRFAGTLGDRERKHWARVAGVAASPDGKRIASAGDDGEVKLHDAATGRTVGVLRGHNAGVRAVAWRPDGQRLASVSWDDTVKVWDAAELSEVRTIPLNQPNLRRAAAWCVAWSRDGGRIAVGTHGAKTVSLWDAETGRLLHETPPQPGPVTAVVFSPDGGRLVSTSEGGAVKLWNAEGLAEVRSFTGHKGHVRSVAFSPDGTTLYTGGEDGTLKAWEVETGKQKQSHDCGGPVNGVAVSGDGATLAVGLGNWTAQLRQASDGKVLQTLKGFRHPVLGVAFTTFAERLATAGWDHTVRLWDVVTGKEVFPPTGHSGEVYQVCASPDGQTIASAGDDGAVRLWDVASRREKQVLQGDSPISSAAFHNGGRELITAGHDGRVRLWDLASGKELRHFFEPNSGGVRTLAYGPGGRTIATSHDHGHVILVWDFASGKVLKKLEGHNKSVIPGLAFTPDGDLVSGSHDGAVKLWDVATGKEKRTLKKEQPHWAWVWGLALDTSGKHLAVAHNHGVVRVWDITSGKLLHEISGLESPPRGVTFARGGALAVSDHGGTLRLYDPATLAEKVRFKLGPRHGLVGSVCASPDGRVLATSNADGTLSLVEAP